MLFTPPPGAETPLDAVSVWQVTQGLEYLRTRNVRSLIESTGESKGQYILGTITSVVGVLRSKKLLARSCTRLEDVGAKLASRTPNEEGDIVLSATDLILLAEVVKPLGQAWYDYLGENNFVDTRPATGMFDYSKLSTMGPSAVFQDSTLLQRLPEEVTNDVTKATAALARGVLTGSVLLSLRAGEAMLRHVYKARLQKEPTERDRWYAIADELFRSLTIPPQEKEELQGFVNGLRLARNKAMHPGSTFGVRDAEDTLVAVRQLVVRLDNLPP